jgi:hypothetical protein
MRFFSLVLQQLCPQGRKNGSQSWSGHGVRKEKYLPLQENENLLRCDAVNCGRTPIFRTSMPPLSSVFWVVTPCSFVVEYQSFRGTYYLQFTLTMKAVLTSETLVSYNKTTRHHNQEEPVFQRAILSQSSGSGMDL